MPPPVVLPHRLVDEVVEVEVLQVLELPAGGGEQLLAHLHVVVHRAADVEEQQHLHRVVPLRDHADVEQAAVAGRRADGVVEVELLRRPLAREAPELAEGHLHVPGPDLHRVVEVPELPAVPHLDGAPVARFVLPDPHPLGVVAVGPERRLPGRPDPLVAALVAPLLLLQALLQLLHQLLEAAHRLDERLLLLAQRQLRLPAKPLLRDLPVQRVEQLLNALEVGPEALVEAVEMPLVLHERGPREVVEVVHAQQGDPALKRFEQGQVLGDRDRHVMPAKAEEEVDQHRRRSPGISRRCGGAGRRAARRGARPARSSAGRRRAAGWPRGRPCCAGSRGGRPPRRGA